MPDFIKGIPRWLLQTAWLIRCTDDKGDDVPYLLGVFERWVQK
jgi:hypothetical protein